jgi:hypothetical protein
MFTMFCTCITRLTLNAITLTVHGMNQTQKNCQKQNWINAEISDKGRMFGGHVEQSQFLVITFIKY